MATAVYIKSESGDDYLFVTGKNLSNGEAKEWARESCIEEEEHWCTVIIERSEEGRV